MPSRKQNPASSPARDGSTTAGLAGGARLLQGIVESAMDAIVVADETQTVVMFNAAAEEMFGCSRADALGRRVEHFMPQHFRQGHALRMAAFASGSPSQRRMGRGRVVQGLRANGQEFPLEASISLVDQPPHQFFTVILRDITQRELDRAALLRSNQDLQQFAFIAAHDLRSPLRSIMGFLGMLQARHGHSLDEAARGLLQRAERAARQLDNLTDDLLSYARAGSNAISMEEVDCNEVLQDTLRQLEVAIAESGALVSAGPLPVVVGSRPLLGQLFQNLLGNALKYSREPSIAVSAHRGPGEWVFSVSDNGIGIAPQYLERIFEIFRRLHTREEYPGNGIGLAICQRIVERHGGRIWVESLPGRGSTFQFSIPDSKVSA